MKRRTLVVGLVVVAGIWWFRGGDRSPSSHPHPRQQAGVLSDGFLALTPPRDVHDGRHVVEYDRDGNRVESRPLRLDGDVRLVGTRGGAGVGWLDKKKLKLAILDADGNPDDPTTWGKKVKQLCQGAASNEYRFGIGWLESDGRVWFVHGPLERMTALEPTLVDGPTAASWCGIASAEQNVVLLWRDGSRLLMNVCTAKKCTSLVVKVPIDSKDALLGYGCVRDSCLFATRDKHGNTKLARVTEKGKAIVRSLDNADSATAISIVGAGSRAFAVSYFAKDGLATIRRVAVDGTFTHVWHFRDEARAPALAWADGKLFAAFADSSYVLDMPR